MKCDCQKHHVLASCVSRQHHQRSDNLVRQTAAQMFQNRSLISCPRYRSAGPIWDRCHSPRRLGSLVKPPKDVSPHGDAMTALRHLSLVSVRVLTVCNVCSSHALHSNHVHSAWHQSIAFTPIINTCLASCTVQHKRQSILTIQRQMNFNNIPFSSSHEQHPPSFGTHRFVLHRSPQDPRHSGIGVDCICTVYIPPVLLACDTHQNHVGTSPSKRQLPIPGKTNEYMPV